MYRGILKKAKHYPSIKRVALVHAIKLDVREWAQEEDDLEIRKHIKKMRMLYGHFSMWEEKMNEINGLDSKSEDKGNVIEKPLTSKEINRKQDEDFVYF